MAEFPFLRLKSVLVLRADSLWKEDIRYLRRITIVPQVEWGKKTDSEASEISTLLGFACVG